LTTPCPGAPAIPTQQICGYVRANCNDERTAAILRDDPKLPKFDFVAIKCFPLGFGRSSPSNSGFGWRNVARISLHLLSFTGLPILKPTWQSHNATDSGLYETCGHQQLLTKFSTSGSHRPSPKRKSLIGFFESQQSWAGVVADFLLMVTIRRCFPQTPM
jgi:hypothetical protein